MNAIPMLPERTVERLSQYRRTLLACLIEGKNNIYSHELANMLHITPVQVRRDIMLIGHSGTLRKGYDVRKLIDMIGQIIDAEETQKVAIIGAGNLGRAIIGYFQGKRTKLRIAAAFDNNPDKVGSIISGIKCYDVKEMAEVISSLKITIAIITVPAEQAQDIAAALVHAGIKGILNYTPTRVNTGGLAWLEEYDMVTSIEKVAYFAKNI